MELVDRAGPSGAVKVKRDQVSQQREAEDSRS